jgi:polar amino acid transport system substrate-binding protein
MPYTYFIGTEPAGYDIELAYRFASWLGMDVEFKVYEWTGLLSAAQGGDADCIMSNLYYTEEHEEAIDFSDILFEVEITAMVKDDGSSDASGNTEAKGVLASLSSLFRGIAESFEKTFIRESRWKLLAQGCVTTLFITVLAVVLGTVLGFAVYLLCRGGNPAANKITRICFWLVDGMPGVVLLMIFYYVIFGGVSISGAWVSVIAFTLVFGSAVYSMLKTGVGAIDKGQTEAACALGYTDRQAFFRVVLPQAVPHILPSYTGQVTSLIKATAVVGYIAVQDLTKMGDIIRSRTYEAFFPLITVAVLYFILAGILSFAVKRIGRLLDTKQRPNGVLLKGVEIHD